MVQSARKKGDVSDPRPAPLLPTSSPHPYLSRSIQLTFYSWGAMGFRGPCVCHLPDLHHTCTALLNLCLPLHPKFHQGRTISSINKMYHCLPGTL